MSKREDIKEHLIELFEQTPKDESSDKLVDAVLWVLNEDGVVIKVDKGLPKMPFKGETRRILIQAGYVAVESLID